MKYFEQIMLSKVAAAAMAITGLLMILGALEGALFVVMARPAVGVVVGHVEGTGFTSKEEVVRIQGKKPERRTVSTSFTGEAAVLQFNVNGEKVEFQSQVHGVKSPYPVGARVDILYDPWNPGYAFVATEASGWAGVLGSALSGSIVVGLGLLTMIVFGGWARHFPNFRLR